MKRDLKSVEERVMSQLKDFQVATVNRVCELYGLGQMRVLIADEVGLGKTIVAKGVIAKTAYHHQESGDNLFKVIYVCSNQNIARQNINKLKIHDEITIDGVTDTRLSMQHLKIFEQENDQRILDGYIQIIPLTPATSFQMTGGSGSQGERALIYAVLKRMDLLKPFIKALEIILMDTAFKGWESWSRDWYEKKVAACDRKSKGAYIEKMRKEITTYIDKHDLMPEIIKQCERIEENGYKRIGGTYRLIYALRMMFARISVDLLAADLVIMDEFQRFKSLISVDDNTESGILARRFLKSNDTKVLLLSATPYKIYSTLEEISENDIDEHYQEFMQVMDFLFDKTKKQTQFRDIWHDYSVALRESKVDSVSILHLKHHAETAMYEGVCRTERIAAMNMDELVDHSNAEKVLTLTKEDIQSYIDIESMMKDRNIKGSVPVEYIKSTPYVMSFMNHYKLKKNIESHFEKHTNEVALLNKKNLWLDVGKIRKYEALPATNAKLELLKQKVFEGNAELLLWVPPSKPYYNPSGVFKQAEDFSKILVFSAWEMVPRMIASMISYEHERRTVGKLVYQQNKAEKPNYFKPNNQRFPVSRLRFNVELDTPRGMSLFTLLYPSKVLANIYRPIEFMNMGLSKTEIEARLAGQIKSLLDHLRQYENDQDREDDSWYYLAPMLLDGPDYVYGWMEERTKLMSSSDADDSDKGYKGFLLHLEKIRAIFDTIENLELGRMPEDLVEILVDMALASPAVCGYRSLGGCALKGTQLAKLMIDQFNKPEATAIVELACKENLKRGHWKNILTYCKDGNLQSVFDEYVHLLINLNGLDDSHNKFDISFEYIAEAMKTHSASYLVDTFHKFKGRMKGKKTKSVSLRTHHAVTFQKGVTDGPESSNRRESVRNSFNSPFRPFVLATTSIGQEGLDFHYYCRKIMHWNLPSNAIDLEQREGRINRYKSLAIRKNMVKRYGEHAFNEDVWYELFEFAQKEFAKEHSELVPFWCLPNFQDVKIERIVPLYPFSKDVGKYKRLIQILAHYRLTLGQTRQEELLEELLGKVGNAEELEKLFINLSPYYRI